MFGSKLWILIYWFSMRIIEMSMDWINFVSIVFEWVYFGVCVCVCKKRVKSNMWNQFPNWKWMITVEWIMLKSLLNMCVVYLCTSKMINWI
jgi:hypothetical protein